MYLPKSRGLSLFEARAFLQAKKHSVAEGTWDFYLRKLTHFDSWLSAQGIESLEEITPQVIREYVSELQSRHNPGGVHTYFRSVRTFLNWCQVEYHLDDWKPLHNVQAPRAMYQQMEAATLDDIRLLLATCDRRSFNGARDDAIIRVLLDTGLRASELLRLSVDDVHDDTITVPAEKTKSKIARNVFLGSLSSRALSQWMRKRNSRAKSNHLWITQHGTALKYDAMYRMLRRRSMDAGLKETVNPHSIRKAFATAMWRSGADLESIRRILGHSTTVVTQTYLRLTDDDLRQSHANHSPGDSL